MKVFAAESVNTGAKRMKSPADGPSADSPSADSPSADSPSADSQLSLIATGIACGAIGALITLFISTYVRNGAVRVHTAGYVVRPQVQAKRQGPTCSSADRRDRTDGCTGPAAHTASIDPVSGTLPVVADAHMAQVDDAQVHGESCAAAYENSQNVMSSKTRNLGDLLNANQSLLHCDFTYGTASITADRPSMAAYNKALNQCTEVTYGGLNCKLLNQDA